MPSSPKRSPDAPNILLVEEYTALAAAFGVALRKAAPQAQTRVVQSLNEAERTFAEHRPDLLILDFDPPQRGAVGFFRRLQAIAPGARVLIIGAEAVPASALNRIDTGAFRFIKKPFELAELGAAVSVLIDTPAGETSTGSRGLVRDLSLLDLILLHLAAAATTVLTVETPDGRTGEVHFLDGRLCHAAAAGQVGAPALQEILQWGAARFDESDLRTDSPRTIDRNWKAVLEEALRVASESATPLLPEPSKTKTDDGPVPAKLVIIDDTELLLIFAQEVLATASPAFEIITATSGLEGFERVKEVRPDLVLLDFSLPDVTGGEVCRRLLGDSQTANTPVIMMSGHVAEMMVAAKEFENVVATIAKPFLSSALIALVERTVADLPKIGARRRKRKKSVRLPAENAQKPNGHSEESRRGATPEPLSQPASSGTSGPETSHQPPPEYSTDEPAGSGSHRDEVQSVKSETLSVKGLLESVQPRSETNISLGKENTIVLNLGLQVVSIQFTPTLRIAAIRARPSSHLVSLHVLPHVAIGDVVTEAPFELVHVSLDERGQIDTVRLTPSRDVLPQLESAHDIPVENLTLLPKSTGAAFELLPAPVAPMRLTLMAFFELAGVELSNDFGVAYLSLKARGGKIRVNLQSDAAQTGATFETVQVLLNRSARIAEVLLDTIA